MAKDAELIFGASSESINQIKTDLGTIIGEVERSGATKLRFTVDTGSTSTAAKQINTLGNSIKLVSQNNIAGVTTSFNKLQASIAKTSASGETLNALNAAFQKLSTAKIAFDNSPTTVNLDSYRAQKTILNGLLDSFNLNQKAIHASENDLLQYKKVLAQVEAEYNRYKANIKKNPELDSNYQKITADLKSVSSGGTNNFKDITDARTQFADLSNTLTETGGKVETFTQKLKNLFGIHLTTALTMVGIHVLIQSLQQMMSSIVEIDTAMTELKKVTDETSNTYSEFLDSAAEKAERLGSTISDIVTATADFARLGYGLPDASTLAEAATVYKNVGDGITDISIASQSIISTMKAFGISASNSMSIVDKFNEVGKQYCPAA